MEYGYFMHLEQNHCQLQVKGNLGKCWLIRSSIYTDITTGVLLIKSDFIVYSDIILVFLFQRQWVSWEHTGLAVRRPGLWSSLPTWPWGSNLFWLRLSFLTLQVASAQNQAFKTRHASAASWDGLSRATWILPLSLLDTTSTSLSQSQPFSVSVTDISLSLLRMLILL